MSVKLQLPHEETVIVAEVPLPKAIPQLEQVVPKTAVQVFPAILLIVRVWTPIEPVSPLVPELVMLDEDPTGQPDPLETTA